MQLKNSLYITVYASLFTQVLTGIFDVYAYFLPVAGELAIIKKLLALEIFVQFIEGAFYVWFASTFSHIHNITPNRYYDWAITTPTMLFTFCLFLAYLGEQDREKRETLLPFFTKEDIAKKESVAIKNNTLVHFLKENLDVLIPIFLLNWLMLVFGYVGELGKMDNQMAVGCGFIPFILYFGIIYVKFAKDSSFYGKILYWVFFSVWSFYGIAALLPYYWKNIFYNILDLVAKNFFGMLFVYILYKNVL